MQYFFKQYTLTTVIENRHLAREQRSSVDGHYDSTYVGKVQCKLQPIAYLYFAMTNVYTKEILYNLESIVTVLSLLDCKKVVDVIFRKPFKEKKN